MKQEKQMQKRILVVDDEPHMVRLVQFNLEKSVLFCSSRSSP
jgi:CheY-like chemotaxis protein